MGNRRICVLFIYASLDHSAVAYDLGDWGLIPGMERDSFLTALYPHWL